MRINFRGLYKRFIGFIGATVFPTNPKSIIHLCIYTKQQNRDLNLIGKISNSLRPPVYMSSSNKAQPDSSLIPKMLILLQTVVHKHLLGNVIFQSCNEINGRTLVKILQVL